MDLKEFFLKQKEAIRRRSEQVFLLLRHEQFDWKPESGALSIGKMLRHLWVSEEGVRRVALEGNFAYYEARIPHGLSAVLGAPATLAEELKNIERVHPGLGFQRKVSVILFGMNEHEVHHRAQLMTYLRMLGTPAPEPFVRR
jgi:uncharacterized damage-inducible protein DinB